MLIELEPNNTITIPEQLTKELNLSEGTVVDIFEKDGCIHIVPCQKWSKVYEEELRRDLDAVAESLISD